MTKLENVRIKYSKLEEYLAEYIDSIAEDAKRDLVAKRAYRWYGIIFMTDNLKGFPSYNHWLFTSRFTYNRLHI